jgi:RND family efflux transporter MFP subunit
MNRILLITISACLWMWGCGSSDKAAELAALKEKRVALDAQIASLEKSLKVVPAVDRAGRLKSVVLSELAPTRFQHFIDIQGRVDAAESSMVTSRVPGSISRILVKNGDMVRKGQLLAELDDAILVKSLAELEGQLRVAEDIYNRQKGLWDQKIGTEIQYIQAKNGKESLERSRATLREQMALYRIVAVQSGTIEMLVSKVGQAIAPGMPLCQIVNMGGLKVAGEVPEVYASKVKAGDPVLVYLPDLKQEVSTRVRFASKTINPVGRTFSVECDLPGGAAYRANMVAVLKIVDYQNSAALLVPVNVIKTAEDGDFVLVADKKSDHEAIVRKVIIRQGSSYQGMVEVRAGLQKGDFILLNGYQDSNDGETVSF